MEIGDRLREERTRLGLSQAEFGAVGGVAANAQGHYESGKRSPDTDYLAKIGREGADVLYIVMGVRGREIDLTLFGLCEAALRQAYETVRPSRDSARAFRTNQLCKLYNSVVGKLKPDDDVIKAAKLAADSLVEFANDPSDADQLDRVLLQPVAAATGAGGVNVTGSGNRTAGRDLIQGSTINKRK